MRTPVVGLATVLGVGALVGWGMSARPAQCQTGCGAEMPPSVTDAKTGRPVWAVVPPEKPGGAFMNVCFAPGTSRKQMVAGLASLQLRINAARRVGIKTRKPAPKAADFFTFGSPWVTPGGTPVKLRWSFVPDGTLADGLPSSLFSTLDGQFSTLGGRVKWISLFDDVYGRWAEISGVRYSQVAASGDADDGAPWGANGENNLRGDLRVSMTQIDGPLKILAYNYSPGDGIGGEMVIDRDENWGGYGQDDFLFLRNTLSHEHGHGLGLGHVCPVYASRLMEPFLATSFDGPRGDDIRGVHTLYGDFYEPNNTAVTAADLGTFASPSRNDKISALPAPTTRINDPYASRTSIERGGVSDFYRFSLPNATKLKVTVEAVGTHSLNAPQNADGSCPTSAPSVNSQAIADLRFSILRGGGTMTSLADVNATPAGGDESVTIELPTGGPFLVQVSTASAHAEAQMYDLRIEVERLQRVTGTIVLKDLNASAVAGQPVLVMFRKEGKYVGSELARLGAGGTYQFDTGSPLEGNYDLTFKGNTWLGRAVSNVSFPGVKVVNVTLENGDVDGDNRVTASDFALVNAAFGSTPQVGKWNARADLNGDQVVNAADVNIVVAGQRRRGDL